MYSQPEVLTGIIENNNLMAVRLDVISDSSSRLIVIFNVITNRCGVV